MSEKLTYAASYIDVFTLDKASHDRLRKIIDINISADITNDLRAFL